MQEGASSAVAALDLTDLGAIAETATPALNTQISHKPVYPPPVSTVQDSTALLDQACALDREEGAIAAAAVASINGVEIDETLFQGEALGELGLEDFDLDDSESELEDENGVDEDDSEDRT